LPLGQHVGAELTHCPRRRLPLRFFITVLSRSPAPWALLLRDLLTTGWEAFLGATTQGARNGNVISDVHTESPLLNPPSFKSSSKSKLVLSRKSQLQAEYGPNFRTGFTGGARCISEAGPARCVVPSSLHQPGDRCMGAVRDGARAGSPEPCASGSRSHPWTQL